MSESVAVYTRSSALTDEAAQALGRANAGEIGDRVERLIAVPITPVTVFTEARLREPGQERHALVERTAAIAVHAHRSGERRAGTM